MPLVSIITPMFNCSSTIIDTYQSILEQSYSDWEWLITDDCSSDNSVAILKEISKFDERVKISVNSSNLGAAHSRNNSIARAKGDFIAFLDSDDLWLPKKLEKQILFMGNNIDFSFTSYEMINESGLKLGLNVDITNGSVFTYEDMLRKKATLGCSTVMLRKAAFDDLTMPLLRTGQDFALWLKLLKSNKKAYKLNECLMLYRVMPNSISRNKIKKALRQWEIYRKLERLSLFKTIICFCYYTKNALFRS
ncbi:glycosyltransferase [Aliivibrio fischeri]|uniref:glycosyltransferase family 2 protein n=1 Tax=Aliivibrio fischeri TaxID=668 RepID=UPI001F3B321E|nr:glycosyltransferase family 2 protein [Aliivibrio fischeri]MCE7566317.1 glycosyltransferase [Aliivibrio fischeri]